MHGGMLWKELNTDHRVTEDKWRKKNCSKWGEMSGMAPDCVSELPLMNKLSVYVIKYVYALFIVTVSIIWVYA